MGLAWGWHGVSMGLAWAACMGPHGDEPTAYRTPGGGALAHGGGSNGLVANPVSGPLQQPREQGGPLKEMGRPGGNPLELLRLLGCAEPLRSGSRVRHRHRHATAIAAAAAYAPSALVHSPLVLRRWCSAVGAPPLVLRRWCSAVGAPPLVLRRWCSAVGAISCLPPRARRSLWPEPLESQCLSSV
jgi:hypothetical protein